MLTKLCGQQQFAGTKQLIHAIIRVQTIGVFTSVSDPYLLNLDPTKILSPDPSYFLKLSEEKKIYLNS